MQCYNRFIITEREGHGACNTFIALSEALKGGFIMTYYIICHDEATLQRL